MTDVLTALSAEVKRAVAENSAGKVVVVYLGDNIYENGLPDGEKHPDEYRQAVVRLNALVDVPRQTGARGIFVPGNHDWARGRRDGWEAIRRQGRYLSAMATQLDVDVELLPRDGCPGPEVVDIDDTLRMVALDTQWWLQEGPKPLGEDSTCATTSEEGIVESLEEALENAGDRHVVVVAHHPPVTGGTHGGTWPFLEWVWPPWRMFERPYRWLGLYGQDLSSPRYAEMIAQLQTAFDAYPPLAFGGGHDHSLQVIEGKGPRFVLISGAASEAKAVQAVSDPSFTSLYWKRAKGFMRLELMTDGRVRLVVSVVEDGPTSREDFRLWLVDGGPSMP
ncbi:MAG: metallophosphoesterase [Acidobacteriota bacterium]